MATEEQNASEATDLKDLCREMFDKITQYLNGELTGNEYSDKYRSNKMCTITATSEEYKLLQQLNQITLAKYTDMCTIAHRLNEVSARVNDNCKLVQDDTCYISCHIYHYVVVLVCVYVCVCV